MKIAVTGAAGTVGSVLIRELFDHGHDVVAVDLAAPAEPIGEFMQADILDIGTLVEAFSGCDAVVHLAAIREAGIAPPEVTFDVNARGTMNAIEAAVRARASRFVHASSEAVLGFAYRTIDFKPNYFPIDEEHPLLPQDCYGVSKLAAEEVCRSYTRKGAITTVCLRPCYCWGPSLGQEAVESIAHPELHYRSLWVYIHLRDIARAYRLACEHPSLDHATAYVVANDIRANVPTAELIERFYPGVPLRLPLGEFGSLIANERIREALGFEPSLSWRDEFLSDRFARSLPG
jgi:nucleoside-diphosphate-sugar epimerase